MTTQDVLAANQAFYDAFEKMDLEAMERVWSKGTGCVCIHPGRNALKGWDQIRQAWEQIFRNTSQIALTTDIVSTEVNENFAYVVLIESLIQVIPERRMEVHAMATNIFERMGGAWYLVVHHGSPIMR